MRDAGSRVLLLDRTVKLMMMAAARRGELAWPWRQPAKPLLCLVTPATPSQSLRPPLRCLARNTITSPHRHTPNYYKNTVTQWLVTSNTMSFTVGAGENFLET